MNNFKAKRNTDGEVQPETIGITIFAILLISGLIFFSIKNAPDPEPQISTWNSEHCLKTVIPANGGILEEATAGDYSYTLIAVPDGTIEVWEDRPCE